MSFALRAVAAAGPLVAATGAAVALPLLLPFPSDPAGSVLWWGVLFGVSVGLVLVLDRGLIGMRVLAELTAMDLAFPGPAPSRIAFARRVGSMRRLDAELGRARLLLVRHLSATPDLPATDSFLTPRRAEDFLALSLALGRFDQTIAGHSQRVGELAVKLGKALELPPEDLDRLRWAALLHDIGKLAVPLEILQKPAGLTADEWSVIYLHPVVGMQMLKPFGSWLRAWSWAVGEHHERWDGSGYPCGLRGGLISPAGRIMAVADAFETMTARRAYKKPMRPDVARRELQRASGTQFDPHVVATFLRITEPRRRLRRLVGLPAELMASVAFPATALAGTRLLGGATALAAAATLLTTGLAVPALRAAPDGLAASVTRIAGAPPGNLAAGEAGAATTPVGVAVDPARAVRVSGETAIVVGPHIAQSPSAGTVSISTLPGGPAVYMPSTVTVSEGGVLSTAGWIGDSTGRRWSALVDYGSGLGAEPLVLNGQSFVLTNGYADEGSYHVTVRVTNDRGESGAGALVLNVVESAPVLNLDGTAEYSRNSASPWSETVSFYDPSADRWSALVDYGDGAGAIPAVLQGHDVQLSHAYPANGNYTVRITVRDDEGMSTSAIQQVNVTSPPAGP